MYCQLSIDIKLHTWAHRQSAYAQLSPLYLTLYVTHMINYLGPLPLFEIPEPVSLPDFVERSVWKESKWVAISVYDTACNNASKVLLPSSFCRCQYVYVYKLNWAIETSCCSICHCQHVFSFHTSSDWKLGRTWEWGYQKLILYNNECSISSLHIPPAYQNYEGGRTCELLCIQAKVTMRCHPEVVSEPDPRKIKRRVW